jgi:hypothetical protein
LICHPEPLGVAEIGSFGTIQRPLKPQTTEPLGLAQHVQPLETLDEGLLRGILGQRTIAQPAPGDGEHLVRVTFDQLAIALAVPLPDRGDRGGVGTPLVGHGGHPPSAHQDKPRRKRLQHFTRSTSPRRSRGPGRA